MKFRLRFIDDLEVGDSAYFTICPSTCGEAEENQENISQDIRSWVQESNQILQRYKSIT